MGQVDPVDVSDDRTPAQFRLASRARQPSMPNVLAVLSAGTLLLAAAYAGGRSGAHTWPPISFWAGWVVSFLALAWAITSSELPPHARIGVVVLQAAQQSLLRWMYSPVTFTFPDELQHWRTASDILASHHLFHENLTLPVSPVFPGLEELATSLVSLTGIGLFTAGSIVAGISHVGLSAALFYLYSAVSGSDRIAGVAAFMFALTPLYAGFDTMFTYTAPALLFGAVVMLVASRRPRIAESTIGVVCLGALVITHHLTAAVVLVALGALGAILAVVTRLGAESRRFLWFFAVGTVLAGLWIWAEAYSVISYLGHPLADVLYGVRHLGGVAGQVGLERPGGGHLEVTALGTLMTASLTLLGGFLVYRRMAPGAERPLARGFAFCALTYYVVLLVRFLAPNGGEYAGRLLTYSALFTSLAMAFALVPTWRMPVVLAKSFRPIAVIAIACVFAGGLMSGWPAPFEQLPGRFRAAAFESGVDKQNRAAVAWFATHVGPNRRIACDFMACALLGAHARAIPIDDAPEIYYRPRVDAHVVATIHERGIDYLFVDLRMTREPPATGSFFHTTSAESGVQERPIPLSALTKFRNADGARLIYSGGAVRIYDVRELHAG